MEAITQIPVNPMIALHRNHADLDSRANKRFKKQTTEHLDKPRAMMNMQLLAKTVYSVRISDSS